MDSGPATILLIDSNPDDRAVAAALLSRELTGVQVREVADPMAFAECLAEGRFDVVVSEYALSWTDGFKVLEASKRHHPTCAVVLFTATNSQSLALEGTRRGLDEFVVKSSAGYLHLPGLVHRLLERKTRQESTESGNEQLVRRLPVGIFSTAAQGELCTANPALVRMLGFADQDMLVGKPLWELVDGNEDRARCRKALERGSAVDALETQLRGADGTLHWVRLRSWPVPGTSDGVRSCEGTVEDITAYKLAQAELSAKTAELGRTNLELERFAYAAARDLQEPMAMLDELVAGGERIRGLLGDIRDWLETAPLKLKLGADYPLTPLGRDAVPMPVPAGTDAGEAPAATPPLLEAVASTSARAEPAPAGDSTRAPRRPFWDSGSWGRYAIGSTVLAVMFVAGVVLIRQATPPPGPAVAVTDTIRPRAPVEPPAAGALEGNAAEAPPAAVGAAPAEVASTAPASADTASEQGVADRPSPPAPSAVTVEEAAAAPKPATDTVAPPAVPAETTAAAMPPAPDTEARIGALLLQAKRQLGHRRFSQPPGNNALETYREILRIDPGHAEARAGIHAVSVRYAYWAELAERRRQWDNAELYYTKALEVEPGASGVEAALDRVRARLRQLRQTTSTNP